MPNTSITTQAVVDVLTRARGLIEQGHSKGQGRVVIDGRVHYCALDALWKADNATKSFRAAAQALITALPNGWRRPGAYEVDITLYNDAASTTQGDVLALYDRAITNTSGDRDREA